MRRLDEILLDRSYIVGFELSAADVEVFQLLDAKSVAGHTNIQRWYTHIKSRESDFKELKGRLVKGSAGRVNVRKVVLSSYQFVCCFCPLNLFLFISLSYPNHASSSLLAGEL